MHGRLFLNTIKITGNVFLCLAYLVTGCSLDSIVVSEPAQEAFMCCCVGQCACTGACCNHGSPKDDSASQTGKRLSNCAPEAPGDSHQLGKGLDAHLLPVITSLILYRPAGPVNHHTLGVGSGFTQLPEPIPIAHLRSFS